MNNEQCVLTQRLLAQCVIAHCLLIFCSKSIETTPLLQNYGFILWIKRSKLFNADNSLDAYIYFQDVLPTPSVLTLDTYFRANYQHVHSHRNLLKYLDPINTLHSSFHPINHTMPQDYDLVLIAPPKSPTHSHRRRHRHRSRQEIDGYSHTTNVTTVTVSDFSGRTIQIRDEKSHVQSRHESRHMPLIREDGYDSDSSVPSVSSDEDVAGRFSRLSVGGRGGDSRSARSATSGYGESRGPYREEGRYIEDGNSRSRNGGSRRSSSGYSGSRDSEYPQGSSRVPSFHYSSSRPTESRHGSSRPTNSHSQYPSSRPSESRYSDSRRAESGRGDYGGELVAYRDRESRGGYSTDERRDKPSRRDPRASKSLGVVKYLAGAR